MNECYAHLNQFPNTFSIRIEIMPFCCAKTLQ